MFYYFPTPSFTCIVDLVCHRVTPLHPEFVSFDIATKRIVFSGRRFAFRDATKQAACGIMSEIDITPVAEFIPLAPGASAN